LAGILGYELGVAVTGAERIGLTIVLTEGFGRIPMARRTYDLLRSLDGKRASANGATQIRAGVQRPEVIVPLDERALERPEAAQEEQADGLRLGDRARIIRQPYFGRIGEVLELAPDLVQIETESKVRVMRLRTEEGEVLTVPRANVEVIEA
jgi:hypothetical protein